MVGPIRRKRGVAVFSGVELTGALRRQPAPSEEKSSNPQRGGGGTCHASGGNEARQDKDVSRGLKDDRLGEKGGTSQRNTGAGQDKVYKKGKRYHESISKAWGEGHLASRDGRRRQEQDEHGKDFADFAWGQAGSDCRT